MQKKIEVKKVTSADDLEKVFAIRHEVFVKEQSCPPELEWADEDDSVHFLATAGNVPAGASRWRKTTDGYKLERFAVLMDFRGSGIGKELVKAVLEDLPDTAEYIYLHAQLPAIPLYARFGFKQVGKQFEEAGIQHYKMVLHRH